MIASATCGAPPIKLISSSLVCKYACSGLLSFGASRKKAVVSWTQLLLKKASALGIIEKKLVQYLRIIHGKANTLSYSPGFRVAIISTEIHRQGHSSILWHYQITECLRSLQLIFFQPFLHERQSVLLKHWLRNFNRLLLIQTTALQHTKNADTMVLIESSICLSVPPSRTTAIPSPFAFLAKVRVSSFLQCQRDTNLSVRRILVWTWEPATWDSTQNRQTG